MCSATIIRMHPLVLSQLEIWFRDYNEVAPHKSLGMRSPRQFIRERQQKMCPGSIAMTQRYGHLSPKSLRNAVKLLQDA